MSNNTTETAEKLLQNGNGSYHGNTVDSECDIKDTRMIRSTSLRCRCSVRVQHAVVGLVLGFILYMYRVNMSIALPYMVKAARTIDQNATIEIIRDPSINRTARGGDDICGEDVTKIKLDSEGAEFTWDKIQQSFVLSGYYYGYLVSQIPLTWATRRFGGKHVITTSMLLSAGLTLLVPVLARASVYALIISRVLLGAASGATIPAWYAILGAWALPHERSRFNACQCFGKCAGSVIGYFTAGVLCANGFDNGWGSVFYVHGAVGVCFVVLWALVISDTPHVHPRIPKEEKALFTDYPRKTQQNSKESRVPWLAILTSLPVWAIFITHTFDNFTQYLILLSLPQFLKDVMRYDIQSNGLFSSFPSISNAIGLVLAGYLADAIITRRWLSTTTVRKLFQTVALVGAAVFIVIPGYMGCQQRAVAIVCLCLCLFFNALGQGVGYPCSAVDIAPRYASVIYSVSNTLATIPGMLGPLAVAELAPNGTEQEWRVVFYIAAGLAISAALMYALFSSSEIAPWAKDGCRDVTIEVISASDELLKKKPHGQDCDTQEMKVVTS